MTNISKIDNPIFLFDATVWETHFPDHQALCKLFHKWCKKWTFQLEKCPTTGNLHYQCHLSLKEKSRSLKWLKGKGSWRPLSIEGLKTNSLLLYVQKEETRIKGPYTDKEYMKFIPMRFRNIMLREWQSDLYFKLKKVIDSYDSRTIYYVEDPKGNVGKSWFAGATTFLGKAIMVPSIMDTPDKMIQCIHAQTKPGWHGIICIDIPRSCRAKHFYNIAQAIEALKQGWIYDWRNKWRAHWIETPAIVVFCNTKMPMNSLSKDMWKTFSVNEAPEREGPNVPKISDNVPSVPNSA